MKGKFKTLLVATFAIASATAATAQPAYYYYYPDMYDVPAEQHRFYDRNSVDFNS
jgi:hypothetical protein